MISKKWVQRRWLDFRNGHSTYLVFAMTFLNFVTIQYSLAVQEIDAFKNISALTFSLIFIAVYIPASIIIGYWHMKRQVPKEQEQIMEVNPYAYKVQPGIAQKYSMPSTVISLDLQLRGMQMTNQNAEAFKKGLGIDLPRWSEEDFKKIEWLREVAIRLQKGEHINTIVETFNNPSNHI